MSRSLKKGPFTDEHLSSKVSAMNDKNEKKDLIQYAIHVRSIFQGDCAVVDPTIKNQG